MEDTGVMAGIFDIHALIALQNGWQRFTGAGPDIEGVETIQDNADSASVVFQHPLPHSEWTVNVLGDPGLGALTTVTHAKTGFTIQSANTAEAHNGDVSWEVSPRYYLSNFRRVFPMVESDVVDSWFDGLVKDASVTFRSYASPGHDDFPLVILQLMSEQSDTDILGNAARNWEDGHPDQYVDSMVVNQEMEVTIMTKSHELTRALFVVVRAILMRYTNTFLKAGYLDVKFLNSAELAPEERLVAEDAGVYVRKQRWRALAQVEAFPITDGQVDVSKPWWIQQSDINTSTNPTPPPDRVLDPVDGLPGGVVPLDE
jgi:hypothetical protein